MRARRKRRYDYGDYYTNSPMSAAPEGTFGQAASPYYTSNNLNTLSVPETRAPRQGFNSNTQGLLATGLTAVGEAIPQGDMQDTAYTRELNERKKLTKTIGAAASAINPLIGAGVAIGSGIGAQTVNEFGEYKSSVGNAIDEQVNPVTGVQGVLRAFKGKQTASGALNKLTVGLFGKSDNQKEAEEGRREFERQRLRAIRERSQQTLADYPVFGYAKYGMKFPNGGLLPYPTDDSEANQLASNMVQYEGSTHDNGGIDLDINQDAVPEIEVENKEVIKDDMVLSNRLRPSKTAKEVAKKLGVRVKKGDTYATLSARIGRKKGDYEANLSSTRPGEKNSAQLMIGRLDEATDLLFMDQQVRKFAKDGLTQFPKGGRYKTKTDEVMPYDPKLRAALRRWELSEIPPALTQQWYPNITLTQGNVQQPYYPVPSPVQEIPQEGMQAVYKPKFPGGGRVPGLSQGPLYTKPNPRTTLEMNEQHAVNNLHTALRFKNNLRGVNGNLVPTGYLNGLETVGGIEKLQQAGGNMAAYTEVDPRAIQRADSVINATRPIYLDRLKGMNNTLATRAFGGYLPTFPGGGPFRAPKYEFNQPLDSLTESVYNLPSRKELWGNQVPPTVTPIADYSVNAPNTNYFRQPNPNIQVPETLYSGTTPNYLTPFQQASASGQPVPRNFDVGDYKTDIAAGIGTIANQLQIGALETQYTPETVDAPRNSYTDRTGYLTNLANEQFTTASRGIQGSSSQDNLALKANLYAKSLSGLNQALDQEFQRKDISDARYNDLVNRTNIINAGIKNQGKYISMENRNKKRALTQANIDNLIRSYIGNETVRDFKETDFARNYLSAASSGDRGVSERFLNSLPKSTRRKLGYKKYGGYIDFKPRTSG